MKKMFLIVFLMAIFIQCSSSGDTISKNPPYDPFMIHEENITRSVYNNAYDVIADLRPQWLRGNRFKRLQGDIIFFPFVYMDQILLSDETTINRFGFHQSLRDITAKRIKEIEYVKPEDTGGRYGSHHKGGMIIVRMQKVR